MNLVLLVKRLKVVAKQYPQLVGAEKWKIEGAPQPQWRGPKPPPGKPQPGEYPAAFPAYLGGAPMEFAFKGRESGEPLKIEVVEKEKAVTVAEKDLIKLPTVALAAPEVSIKETEMDVRATNITYPLIPIRPAKGERIYAYANIKWSPTTHTLVYSVIEPQLSQDDLELLKRMKDTLQERLDVSFTKIKSTEAERYLDQKIDEVLQFLQSRPDPAKKDVLVYYIKRDFIGLGKIEPFMHDPYIEDISCLPSFEKVLVKKSGELQLTEIGKLIDGEVGPGNDTVIANPLEIEVLSFDPVSFKACFKSAEALIRRKNEEGHYIRIRAEGGNFINTSPDHPVLILAESGIETKTAKDVREGDYLISLKSASLEGGDVELDLIDTFAKYDTGVRVLGAKSLLNENKALAERLGVKWYAVSNWKQNDSMPLWAYLKLEDSRERRKTLQISGGQGIKNRLPAIIKLDENFAEFVGLFLAEGYFGNSNIQLSFGKHEKDLCERVAEMARKMFGCTSKVVEKETSLVVYCGGKMLQALFENVLGCGRDSYTKRVPDIFYKTSESVRKALIRGVWLGDGYIRCDDRVNKAVLATASTELAWGIRFIMKTFGVSTHLHARSRRFANTWEVSVERGESMGWIASLLNGSVNVSHSQTQLGNRYPNFLFNLNDFQGVDRKLVRNALGAGKRLGLRLASKSQNQTLYVLLNGDIHPTKVIGTEIVKYSGPFYDLKVKDYSNFMHGDFVFTHNCDGTGIPIYIYHRNPKIASVPTNVSFEDKDELDSFVLRLAQKSGRSISMAEPLVDAALPDGSRLQATLSTDIARRGSNFTIRKFTERPLTPTDVINFGTCDSLMMAYFWMCIEHGKSILVSGGTATGKTTLLNVLSFFISPEMKIVSIEDTPELRLTHPHWVPEVAREPISTLGEKEFGKVDLFDLLKSSLRQRPDYIIVGEVRGQEAYVLFQQIATGHTGLSTLHAENLEKLVDRLVTAPINLSPSLIETLDIVIFIKRVKRKHGYVRRVESVYEIVGFDREKNFPVTNVVFKWDPVTDLFASPRGSYLLKKIAEARGFKEEDIRQELINRVRVLEWMRKRNITDYRDVGKIMSLYYATPEAVLQRAEAETAAG